MVIGFLWIVYTTVYNKDWQCNLWLVSLFRTVLYTTVYNEDWQYVMGPVHGFHTVLYITAYTKDWQWLVTGQYVSLVYYIVPQQNWSAWYNLILMKVTSNTHSYNYFLSSFYYLYWPRVTFYKFSRLDEIGHVIYDGLLTVMLCLLQRP